MRHFARRYFNLLIISYVMFKIAVKTKKEPQGFFFAVFSGFTSHVPKTVYKADYKKLCTKKRVLFYADIYKNKYRN